MSRGMNGKGKRLPVTRTNAAQAALEPGRSDGRFESPDEGSQPAHRASATPARFDVVALVTSAGGLEAVSAVLRDLPADFPAAVVVAQHLSGQGSEASCRMGIERYATRARSRGRLSTASTT